MACTSGCFCPTPWCDCVIYWPPVARTSDLYDDTELTVPVLAMAQGAPQHPEEQSSIYIERKPSKSPRGDKRVESDCRGLRATVF